MVRSSARTLAVLSLLGAWSGWACSVTPHFVGTGGTGGGSSSSSSASSSGTTTSSSASSSASASSASSAGSTSSSASSASSSSGSKCSQPCVALDACHLPGTCDPQTGNCSNPTRTNGEGCATGDACNPGMCSSGVCIPHAIACNGGQVCQAGACVCPAGTLWCASQAACESLSIACGDASCHACGYVPACDGQLINDAASGFTATCAFSVPACSSANAQNSNNADQNLYYQGSDRVCVKQDGTYGWYPRMKSASQGGAGCLSVYAHCTYFCSALFPFEAYCNAAGDFDPNLANAPGDGCGQLAPPPSTWTCP